MFYQHSRPQPYHLSVAAIVFDSAMEICVHHFRAERAGATSRRLLRDRGTMAVYAGCDESEAVTRFADAYDLR
jgi:hypothetical protein